MRIISLFLSVLLLAGCVTRIAPTADYNPPPSETFNNFTHFDLRKVELNPSYQGHSINYKAATKVDENMRLRVGEKIKRWNKKGDSQSEKRTLLIKPVVEEVKFIYGAARYFAGPFAGSSAVRVKVQFVDKDTGQVIAEPEFYQRANAFAGTFSFSVADSLMLTRTGEMIADYIVANYSKAVGGAVSGQ